MGFYPQCHAAEPELRGTDHHIRIEFTNNSQYYTLTEGELKQPKAFRSHAENGITLQLEAICDGATLIQRFGYENGNYIYILSSKLIHRNR